MSRIGKQPIQIPDDVETTLKGTLLTAKGPKGELSQRFHEDMKITIDNGSIEVTRPSDEKSHKALHGLTRALIANMVHGVHEGYETSMVLIGIGYSVELRGDNLIFQLGYSHPIIFGLPEGVSCEVQKPSNQDKLEFREMTARMIFRSVDKQLLGQVCAKVRSFRKPEPYKGKGIRFDGEYVRKKAGKQVSVGTL